MILRIESRRDRVVVGESLAWEGRNHPLRLNAFSSKRFEDRWLVSLQIVAAKPIQRDQDDGRSKVFDRLRLNAAPEAYRQQHTRGKNQVIESCPRYSFIIKRVGRLSGRGHRHKFSPLISAH